MRFLFVIAAILLGLCAATPSLAQKTKSALITQITGNFPDNSAGAITPQVLRTVTTDMVNSWQQYAGVNPQAGTSYTIGLSDYGQLVTFSNVGAIAVSLPQAAGAFATFNFTVAPAVTSGGVTVTPTGGSTINGAASYAAAPGTSTWIVSDGTNWQVAKGSGSGTVNAGTINQLAYYAASTAVVSGAPNTAIGGGTLTLGTLNSVLGSLALTGSTSGTATISPQATAGTPTLTLPNTSGTFAVNASAPLALSATTGALTCATCATTTNGGALSATAPVALSAAGAISITGLTGGVLAGAGPAFTTTPVLGASGTLGTLGFGNAISGTVTLQPVAGALGSAVLTMPAATDTLAVLATSQAFTNKTYNGLTVTSTTGTLTLTNAKTLTVQNSLTFSGTDAKALVLTNGLTVSGNDGTLSFGAASKTLTANNSITLAGTDATTWTGPSTNATLAALNINSQTLAGGANVTSLTQSTGNITVDCGQRPLQFITNGAAFIITAPASDGSCLLLVTNNATAGAITFSGFSVGSNTGDALTTTNTNKFTLSIWRINGTSGYRVAAHQ